MKLKKLLFIISIFYMYEITTSNTTQPFDPMQRLTPQHAQMFQEYNAMQRLTPEQAKELSKSHWPKEQFDQVYKTPEYLARHFIHFDPIQHRPILDSLLRHTHNSSPQDIAEIMQLITELRNTPTKPREAISKNTLNYIQQLQQDPPTLLAFIKSTRFKIINNFPNLTNDLAIYFAITPPTSEKEKVAFDWVQSHNSEIYYPNMELVAAHEKEKFAEQYDDDDE